MYKEFKIVKSDFNKIRLETALFHSNLKVDLDLI